MTSTILTCLADERFAITSLAEFLEGKRARISGILNVMSSVISSESKLSDEEIKLLLVQAGWSEEAYIALASGSYPILDVLRSLNATNDSTTDADDGTLFDLDTSMHDLVNAFPTGYTFQDFVDEIAISHESIACFEAAAMAQTYNGDKLLGYRDTLTGLLSNGHQNLSGINSLWSQLITQNLTDSDFLDKVSILTSVKDYNEDDDFDFVNTPAYQFTGANPVTAIAMGSAATVAGQVVNTALRVAATALKKVCSFGIKLLAKPVKFAYQTLANPDDLECIDDKGEGTIAQTYHCKEAASLTSTTLSSAVRDVVNGYIGKYGLFDWPYFNKWIRMSTVFADIMIRDRAKGQIGSDNTYIGAVDYAFKPRVINVANWNLAVTKILGPSGSASATMDDLYSVLTTFRQLGTLAGSDLSENERYQGLRASMVLLLMISSTVAKQLSGDTSATFTITTIAESAIGTITNADWYQLATGILLDDNGDPSDLDALKHIDESVIMDIIANLWAAFLIVMASNDANPLMEAYFPYSLDKANFGRDSWAIKTDDTNAKAAESFLATALIITTAVIILAGTLAGLSLAKGALFKLRAAKYTKLLNKLSVQGSLSISDWNRLRRVSARLNAANAVTSSLFGSISVSSPDVTSGQDSELIHTVYRSIVG